MKVFCRGPDPTNYIASKALNCLNELGFKDPRISLLKVKLHLFLIGLAVKDRGGLRDIEKEVSSEIQLIELCKAEIDDEEVLKLIDLEIAFAITMSSKITAKGLPTLEGKEPINNHHVVISLLEGKCLYLLDNFLADQDFERAKVSLLICETRIKSKDISDASKESIVEAIKVFQKYECIKLEIRAHICLAKLNLM